MVKESDESNILPDDYYRVIGKRAQRNNIMAAKLVAEAVRTTLGPKGMDKMIVDPDNNVIVTNDGAEILSHLRFEHPVARMIADVSKNQERSVGDGTTTAAVFTGELLSNAERLLDMNIHPSIIIKGYKIALNKAKEFLEEISIKPKINDEILMKIAETAMTGKGTEQAKTLLADICVRAIKSILSDSSSDESLIDSSDILIRSISGGSIEDSRIVQGILLEKEKINPSMPKLIKNPKILLLDEPIQVRETEIQANVQITTPEQMHQFIDMEDEMIEEMVESIASKGINVVFCQKGIDNLAAHYLARKGILALRRLTHSEMLKLAKMTNAKIVSSVDSINDSDLGHADVVREERINDENYLFVERKESKVITIIARGSTIEGIDEVKRSIDDAIGDLITFVKTKKVVCGAGACEMALLTKLSNYSEGVVGKERLAVEAFSQALEIIPKTLAENAGLDSLSVLSNLKVEHKKGNFHMGIDESDGRVIDAFAEGIIEPFQLKLEAITSATELAIMILRIDDVIYANLSETKEKEKID
ncbi:MAG: archaeal chaperonin [Candidatus Woesearchaeota archaeon]|nr:archaeal chaperonin [Candidatus Woesearchaeota archaeon]